MISNEQLVYTRYPSLVTHKQERFQMKNKYFIDGILLVGAFIVLLRRKVNGIIIAIQVNYASRRFPHTGAVLSMFTTFG